MQFLYQKKDLRSFFPKVLFYKAKTCLEALTAPAGTGSGTQTPQQAPTSPCPPLQTGGQDKAIVLQQRCFFHNLQ